MRPLVAIILAASIVAPAGAAAEELSLEALRQLGFRVEMLDGTSVALAELLPEGRPAVVEMWATWCSPCRKMTPRMVSMHAKWAPRGVTVVGLTVENPESDRDRVAGYVEKARVGYPIGFVPDGLYEAMNGNGKRSVPKVFVFDSSGRLVKHIRSYTPFTMRHIESAVARVARAR